MHKRSAAAQPAEAAREFRKALGAFTTGVTIVTARAQDGTPVGVTVNSFNSVSLDPPMVLWSLAKSARSLEAFDLAEHFAVHILSVEQEDLSNRFAKSGVDKFDGVETRQGVGDTPLLMGCCTTLQCRTTFKYEGGDHIIFVGEVIEFDHNDRPPLVFQLGKYAVAARKTEDVSLASNRRNAIASSFGEDFLGYLLWRSYYQFHRLVRESSSLSDLMDPEFFVLLTLLHREGRTSDEVFKALEYTGLEVTEDTIRHLYRRKLVYWSEEVVRTLYLTEEGRDITFHILAAAKSIESNFLEKLGWWEAISFKKLLKQFIYETDPGVPHLWDAS